MMIKLNNELYDLSMNRERALLHEELDRLFWEQDGEYITEEMEEELQEAHDLISAQDEQTLDGFIVDNGIYFESVSESTLLKEALKTTGYTFESSNVSRSIYVTNDRGEEVRIADHKRPAAQTIGGNYVDHEYDNELIIEDNKVTAQSLRKYGIELEEGEYLLG